ncbi:MAG: M56 family metallopeptidase [Pseudomonadota bacterium]
MTTLILDQSWDYSWLTLRDVLRLLLLSGLFTLAALLAFPKNAPSRRVLVLAAVLALLVLPPLLGGFDVMWTYSVQALPSWTLSAAIPNLLTWIWLTVAAVLALRHARAVLRELQAIYQLPDIENAQLAGLVHDAAAGMGVSTPLLKAGDCACSTSLLAPTLILPHDYERWDDTILRSVVAHELVHLKRRDDVWLLIARLVILMYWWMPWLMWLYRAAVQVVEESCDDAASNYVGAEVHYVSALVDVAKHEHGRVGEAVTNMSVHHLVGRVGRFADTRAIELDTRGVYWCVTAVLLLVLGLSGMQPVQKRHLVTVEGPPHYPLPVTREYTPATIPQVLQYAETADHIQGVERERLHYPLTTPTVIYPGTALNERLEGEVTVEYNVLRDGSVSRPVIVRSKPQGVFDTTVLRSVRSTRYRPAYDSHGLNSRDMNITRRTNDALTTQPPQTSPLVRRHFLFRLQDQ